MQTQDASELVSSLELIEAQPLAARAAGYEALYEQLLDDLQRTDQAGGSGYTGQSHGS